MTVFVRRDTCALCEQRLFWNDETKLLTCDLQLKNRDLVEVAIRKKGSGK